MTTASFPGWDGLKNGKLLEAAEMAGFEVLVTGDQTLCYEQNLPGRRLAIVALSSIEWRIIKAYLPSPARNRLIAQRQTGNTLQELELRSAIILEMTQSSCGTATGWVNR